MEAAVDHVHRQGSPELKLSTALRADIRLRLTMNALMSREATRRWQDEVTLIALELQIIWQI